MLILTCRNLFLSEEKQKSIDIESICELLNIVLRSEYPSQVDLFIEYLKVSACICIVFSRVYNCFACI